MSMKKKYAIVGLGSRHLMYRHAILETYPDTTELVGLCDRNQGRLDLALTEANGGKSGDVRGFLEREFEAMIRQTNPDCVIVCVQDNFHDGYICRALELGCDVITEKPMTIDAQKCKAILDAQSKTGRNVTVTFNYRYAPARTQVKDLLMSGVIGEVLSVDFHWLLDTYHGADYFRRWHRNKANSGGLLVHKATHHFDLVNWWLSTTPERVYASGDRRFYLPQMAARYGLEERGERCATCEAAGRCPFYLDLDAKEGLRQLYLSQESYDGYWRDQCVFSEKIDIEDTISAVVDYKNGARLSYSLTAYSPWEGYTVVFNGTKGRLEHKIEESAYISGDGSVPGALKAEGTWIRVYPHWGAAYEVDLWAARGGHGGADPVMLDYLFAPEQFPEDKYIRCADQRAGAWSILVGVAANQSIASGQAVRIDDLLPDIAPPDYPPMPETDAPLPLPGGDHKVNWPPE